MTARRVVPTEDLLIRSLSRQARRQRMTDARLRLRDDSHIGALAQFPTPSTGGSGSCLTAVPTFWVWNPNDFSGYGGDTVTWEVLDAMNLVALQVRCQTPPSGSDVTVTVESTTNGTIATVVLDDGVDDSAEWTGTVAVAADERLYILVAVDDSVDLYYFVVQAWFDGPGGGGLLLHSTQGA